MPNEVIEIEEAICRVQKDISDTQRSLRENEREIKKYIDKLDIAKNLLRLNLNSKKHIKNNAEVVQLSEYQIIKEKIEEMEDEIKECNIQLSILQKSKILFQSSISLNNTLLNESMKKLSTYKRVIPLKALNVE